jgi:hypothetical protein
MRKTLRPESPLKIVPASPNGVSFARAIVSDSFATLNKARPGRKPLGYMPDCFCRYLQGSPVPGRIPHDQAPCRQQATSPPLLRRHQFCSTSRVLARSERWRPSRQQIPPPSAPSTTRHFGTGPRAMMMRTVPTLSPSY